MNWLGNRLAAGRAGGDVRALFVALFFTFCFGGAPARAFEHGDYDALLKEFVDANGRVDYEGLIGKRAALNAYVKRIGRVEGGELRSWPRNEQIAFFINAYNAITLVRIIDDYPPRGSGLIHPKVSIRNIKGVWDKLTNEVAGQSMTLDYIEHNILRPVYDDPRLHTTIVCASVSCPNLAAEAYTAERLEEQIEREAERFARDPTKSRIDPESKRVTISAIFEWFSEDFERYESEVPGALEAGGKVKALAGGLGFLARFGPPEYRDFLRSGDYKLRISKYDWGLNSQ